VPACTVSFDGFGFAFWSLSSAADEAGCWRKTLVFSATELADPELVVAVGERAAEASVWLVRSWASDVETRNEAAAVLIII